MRKTVKVVGKFVVSLKSNQLIMHTTLDSISNALLDLHDQIINQFNSDVKMVDQWGYNCPH